MMKELDKISKSLEASIADESLCNLAIDGGDMAIEIFMEAANGVPFLGLLTKGIKSALAIRELYFYDMVVNFLSTLGQVPTTDRLAMIEKINKDPKYSEKFGKVSLIALDRFDDLRKGTFTGQAAAYLARNEIDFVIYKRLLFIIGRLYYDDITTFILYDKRKLRPLINEYDSLGLLSSEYTVKEQLATRSNDDRSKPATIKITWERTMLGNAFTSIILNEKLNSRWYANSTVEEFTQKLLESLDRDYISY